jgi:hypothetical protein
MRASLSSLSLSLALALAACSKPAPGIEHRVSLIAVDGSNVRLVPRAGQLPWCLVFTRSWSGIVRQMTMSEKNLSVPCAAEKPIGDLLFKIPPQEGRVKIHVVFSDRELEAIPIAQQIRELADKGAPINGIDLRAPGTVIVDTFEFEPK